MTDVIVTAPHALCLGDVNKRRTCDIRARGAAQQIAAYLRQQLPANEYRVTLDLGDTQRAAGDLNRAVTRHWPWRERVQARIDDSLRAGRRTIVLDIHSFPNIADSFGIDKRTGRVPKIVLLDYGLDHRALYDAMPTTVVPYEAAAYNDITGEARKAGADAMLWEFNEDGTALSDNEIGDIADFLLRYVERGNRDGTPSPSPTTSHTNNNGMPLVRPLLIAPMRIECLDHSLTLADLAAVPIYVQAMRADGHDIVADERVFVVRDDLICGGTKTRVLHSVLQQVPHYAAASRYAYVSNTYGTAPIVLAWTVARLPPTADGRQKVAVIEEHAPRHKNPQMAVALGAQLVSQLPAWRAPGEVELPSGFREQATVDGIGRLAQAVGDVYGQFDQVWSVASTGTLAYGLQRGDLGREYHVVNVNPYSGVDAGGAHVHEHTAPVPVAAPPGARPPFPSNVHYDAKAWRYVVAAHQRAPHQRILFWNVAS